MTAFLDTHVLIRAFASRGLCADLFELVLLEHELVLGRNVLRELKKALRGKVKLSESRAAEIVGFVSDEAIHILTRCEPAKAAVEADDALVLGEALGGEAEVFVTGDAALLELGSIEKRALVSPWRFWEILRSTKRRDGTAIPNPSKAGRAATDPCAPQTVDHCVVDEVSRLSRR